MLSHLISCKCPGIGLTSSYPPIDAPSAAHLPSNPLYSQTVLCKTNFISSLHFRSCKCLPIALCMMSKLLGWPSHSQPHSSLSYHCVPSHPYVAGYTINSHFLAFIPRLFHPPLRQCLLLIQKSSRPSKSN